MQFDASRIRKDYPCLSQKAKGPAPIYFDNACMTLKPNEVLEAEMVYYLEHPSCHNRAIHSFGKQTTKKYDDARQTIKKHLNAGNRSELVFTRNTTESINLVANSFHLREGDVVLTSDAEHNSNLLPWQLMVQKKGIVHKTFSLAPDQSEVDLDEFEEILGEGNVKLVSVFFTSHVTGMTLPIKEMTRMAHEHGAVVLIDAAQSVAHHKLDVQDLGVDFLALSFHKAFGPTGMGGLYGERDRLEQLPPFIVGGETVEDVDYDSCTMSSVPARFEAGLQNYAGALGSARALDYLEKLGIDNVQSHEQELNAYLTDELSGRLNLKILGPADSALRGSIVNVEINGLDAGEVSIILSKTKNIMVRSGVHCCHAWYRKYERAPSLRVSVSVYNTMKEAEIFVSTLHTVLKHFSSGLVSPG